MKHRSLSLPEMPDDGFRWNKYGEKTIRGGTAIREYFRCQLGCPADKGGTSCPARKVMDRSLSQAPIADQPKKEEEEEEENEEGQQKQQHHQQKQQREQQQQDDGLPASRPTWARKPQQAKGKRRPSSFKGEFSVQYLCQEHNHPPSPPAAASPTSTATAAAAEPAPSAAAAATLSECGASRTPLGAFAAKARGFCGPMKQNVRSRFKLSHLEIPNGSSSPPPSSSGSTGPATPHTPWSSSTPSSSACHPPLRSPSLVPPRLARGVCESSPSMLTSSPSPSPSSLASSAFISLPKSPGVAGGKAYSNVPIPASATTTPPRGLSANVTSTATSSSPFKGNPGRGAVGQKAAEREVVSSNASPDCMSRKRNAGQFDARPASTTDPISANSTSRLAQAHPPALSLPAQVQGLTAAKKQKTETLEGAEEEEVGLCQTISTAAKPMEDGEALMLELFESLESDDDLPHLHVEEQLSPRPALSRSLTYGDRTLPDELSSTLARNGAGDVSSLATDSPWPDFGLVCDKALHSILDTPLSITSSTSSQEPHFHNMTEGVVPPSPTACPDTDPGDPCLRMVASNPPMPAKPWMPRGKSATTEHPGSVFKSAGGDSCPHPCSRLLSLTAETSPKTLSSAFDSGSPQVHNSSLHLLFPELFPATEPRPHARRNGSSLGSGSDTEFQEETYRTCAVGANDGSAVMNGACHVGSDGGQSSDESIRRSSICEMDATTATSQVMEAKTLQSPPRLGGGEGGKGFKVAGQHMNQLEPHSFRSCVGINEELGVSSTNVGSAPIAGKAWDTSTPLTLEDFLLTRLIFHVTELLKR